MEARLGSNSRRGVHGITRIPVLFFWFGGAIFVLNDFVFMAVKGTYWVFVADYVFRVAILLLVLMGWRALKGSGISLSRFLFLRKDTARRRGAGWIGFAWVVGASVYGLTLHSYVRPFLHNLLPHTQTFAYHHLTGIRRLIDLFPGIGLVALSEEAFFRGFAFRVLGVRTKNESESGLVPEEGNRWTPMREMLSWRIGLLLILFGIAHWSNGIDAVLTTALTGAAFAAALLFTGSLWPALIAHFVIDFATFGGLV